MEVKEYELGDLLAYEQPTPYIVESTKYSDTYKTPVLTAGKSFIIGHTNETTGIYENLPAIIFDDFTTSSQFVNFKFKVKSSAMKILTANTEIVLPKYVFYRMQIINFDHSTHKRYWIQHYSKLKVQIPSLPEQEKIIKKIEELFSELDKSVETLHTIKQQLAVYRQAVLKEAFEGKLTSLWRKMHLGESPQTDFESIKRSNEVFKDTSGDENEIHLELPPSWIKVRFGDVFEVQVGATPSRRIPEYWNGTINWVSSGEVHFNTILRTDEQITADGLAHASTNVHPVGTVMLAMIGEGKTRGQAAILNIEAAHNQNTAAILVSKTACSSKYIYYFLQMNYDNTRRVGSGNNQKALNKERVRALRFPFTSFAEQKMIVEEIESRLSVCDSIEQTVDTALVQAEAMRQSILKQAFEGGLPE
ncbi:restriction endonuclease subunit S [Clostridium sp. C105KSO13]|uniref:restriction endonuclease subunit S n=1 Tax=Clostridium sp. C105KSO13 TaxID=1776045 RepID=UPI00074085D0|nr:restriction endonuclease subunit S [Clostridium sp. C105KSO13]CUX36889.1 EcoKI restriction-modification system protein HsdS [Clostridium sp. C105KSO13]